MSAVTDLRMGQIGHGLGPAQLIPMTTHYKLKIWETALRHDFTIYLETSGNANAQTFISTVTTQ